MSLAEKWEEFKNTLHAEEVWTLVELQLAQRAFYAGAEAALGLNEPITDMLAEIDHFRSHK